MQGLGNIHTSHSSTGHAAPRGCELVDERGWETFYHREAPGEDIRFKTLPGHSARQDATIGRTDHPLMTRHTVKSPDLIATRRQEGRPDHPVRIVVDSGARTPVSAAILNRGPGERIIACSNTADPSRVAALAPLATIIQVGESVVDLPQLLRILGDR